MKKNRIIFNTIYLIIVFVTLLIYYYCRDSLLVDDFILIVSWFCVFSGITIIFNPLVDKIINGIIMVCFFYYLTRKTLDIFIIISLVIPCIFIYLYFKRISNNRKISIFRVVGLLLFLLAYYLNYCYVDMINEVNERYCVNLTYEPYYYYYHFDNTNDFISKFGMLSYLNSRITNKVDLFLNRNENENIINDYANRNEIIGKNNYSGIFKDNNIIVLQTTDLYKCFISEDLTPNLYRLMNDGIYVDGFSNLLTNYGGVDYELMTNLSLFPIDDNGYYGYLYDDIPYGTTLASIFNNNGYKTYMAINDYSIFYNRERLYKTYKYLDIISPYNYGLDGYQDNDVMFQNMFHLFDSDDKTMIYYSPIENEHCESKQEFYTKEKYPFILDQTINKINNLIDLDNAIGKLLINLEQIGQLDNTVIIVYGVNDDITFGVSDYAYRTGTNDETMLMIYKKGIEHANYFKKSSSIDLLPTISNLFGFTYDNSRIIGRDIFDDSYNGMQITNCLDYKFCWYNNILEYNYYSGDINTNSDIDIAKKDVLEMKRRMKFSNSWFKYGKYYNK